LCGHQLSTSDSSRKCTAGFVGFGRIAQATLARLIPFGFRDALYSSRPSSQPNLARDEALVKELGLNSLQRVSLDRVASESDVVFVLTPGGSETNNLINEDFIRKMKKTSVLVNTGRGTVVDSDALAKALREGWIWGAGLDVVAGEPNVLADHPLVKEPRYLILALFFFSFELYLTDLKGVSFYPILGVGRSKLVWQWRRLLLKMRWR
jgi:glyoxylate/hydroxypyruvate reductase